MISNLYCCVIENHWYMKPNIKISTSEVKKVEMALVPLSPAGGDVLRRRVPQSAISGHMFLKMKTDPAFYGRTRASTTDGTVPIPVVMHSPEPVHTAGHHFPLDTQPGRLPLLHDNFPPKSKVGTGRSFTMFPLITYGTRDAPKNEIPTLKTVTKRSTAERKLPELELELREHQFPKLSQRSTQEVNTKYVDAYKNRLRRKGFDVKEVYSVNRNRSDRHKTQNFEINPMESRAFEGIGSWKLGRKSLSESKEMAPKMKTTDKLNFKNYKAKKRRQNQGLQRKKDKSRVKAADNQPRYDMASGSSFSENDNGKSGQLEKEFMEFVEEYSDPQGMKRKTRNYGRKLGNIVTPLRMSQLLEAENPIKMENYYNHYM